MVACIVRLRAFTRWDRQRQLLCVRSVGMTYIVNESCIKCKYMDCVEVCPGGLLLRRREHARHPSRTNASIAASASRNARSTPSSRIPSRAWRSGWNSTPNTPRPGRISRSSASRRPTPRSGRACPTNSRIFFDPEPGRAIEQRFAAAGNGPRLVPWISSNMPIYWRSLTDPPKLHICNS